MSIFDSLKPRGGLSNHEFNMKYGKTYRENYDTQQKANALAQEYLDNPDTYLGDPGHQLPPGAVGPTQPGTNTFREDMDPRERFARQRNYEMISSGDPMLQKQGLANQGSMQGNMMAGVNQKPATAPNLVREWQAAREQGYQGSLSDWKQMGGAKTEINMPKGAEDYVKTADLDKMIMPDGSQVPLGTTYKELRGLGAKLKQEKSGETAGKMSMLQTALNNAPVIGQNILNDDGSVDEKVLWEIVGLNSNIPGIGLAVSDEAKLAHNAMEMGIQAITRTETGAAMPPEEVQNTKARFMPKPWDNKELIEQKMSSYVFFLTNALSLMDPHDPDNKGMNKAQRLERAIEISLDRGNDDKKDYSDTVFPAITEDNDGLPEGWTWAD